MHRLFAPVIAPLIEALEPRTIVETGAGSGSLTRRLLDSHGGGRAVIHAIDPWPRLDPALVEAAGPRLQLHPERAIGAVGRLGAVDLALLDGDPCWYSVHSELAMLIAAAERAGRAAPAIVVHNVHWPFGRRDGYYDPEAIPEADRRECTDLGLVPGHREPQGDGLRLAPFCALRDFEPRSGVLSAIEDTIAESDLDWTLIEVPGFHGVAALAEARLLAERPALAAVLTELGSTRFLRGQARKAESARLAAEVEVEAARELAAALSAEAAARVEGEDELVAEDEEAPIGEEEVAPVEDAPQPGPEPELQAAEPADPDLVRALESERNALLAEVAEHRARREALEWRVGLLDQDLAAERERLVAVAAERDAERDAAVEARVRLEVATAGVKSAGSRLEDEERAADELRSRVNALERQLDARGAELTEIGEREKLAQGRLAHSEDSQQALQAERDRLGSEVEGLRDELIDARARFEEIADQLRQAGQTRRARLGTRLARIGRAVTFGRERRPSHLEAARAAAERALPAAVEEHPGIVAPAAKSRQRG